ncbi:MAG TPA: tetrahydrofolate dehydrogenase/cyclohydrolase catalytic domain-containing protein, partial [Bacilli bacterium]|nr:tetrahydrofolate dehydrogenase/cyclohydrolase catalytic domain-containing protein [Bacilli bacterium]
MTIKEYVKVRKEEIKDQVSKMARPPFLVIVQINEDAGSNAYVHGKLKDAEELGVKAELIKLPLDVSEAEAL